MEGFPFFGGEGVQDGIYTPRDIKGGSEEADETPMTAEETRERLRLHAFANAQSSAALAQVADDGCKASDSDTSDDSSVSSGVSSASSQPKKKKSRASMTTPRKTTSGLQQVGSSSGSKKKAEASPASSAAVSGVEERLKMQETADAINAQLQKYAAGYFDTARGRELQGLHRTWTERMSTARKLLKNEALCDERRALHLGLQQLEATMSLMKSVVKTSGSYLETASSYDTLKLVNGSASEGCARALLDRNVDGKLGNRDSQAAIALMTNHGGASHDACELIPAEKVPEVQKAIATKVTQATFKVKVTGPIEDAQREGADLTTLLKQQIGFASLSDELKTELEVMFVAMNLSCADEAGICRAGMFVSRFPVPDARKPPDSPFAAFLLSKVGKQAVKSLALAAETAAKADSAIKEYVKVVESMKGFTELQSIPLRLLQLEVMPLLRKAKSGSKCADAVAVQELLSCTRSLFVTFGTDLLGRMFQCAPFLFEEVALFTASPAPAQDFKNHVGELKAFREMWCEIWTEILPAAAAGTAAALPIADLTEFTIYAELAQEIASTTLSETPPGALQSLRGRLLDLLEPKAWASIAESVSGPTSETPPICDI